MATIAPFTKYAYALMDDTYDAIKGNHDLNLQDLITDLDQWITVNGDAISADCWAAFERFYSTQDVPTFIAFQAASLKCWK